MTKATKPYSNRIALVFDFDDTLVPDTVDIAVLDWVQYSLSPSRTRYLNENQMKAGEKIRAKIGLLGRLNIK
jgi:hypothetical protein